MRNILMLTLLSPFCSGCTVVAVTVVATTAKVGATVVGTTIDVAAGGVKAVTGNSGDKK